jgi:selenocysteine lyase/cysteine desulfurase
MLDITRLRNETPGCANRIHLNNAGASLLPQSVVSAMHDYIQLEAEIGGYEAYDARAAEIDGFYTAVARLLGAQPRNIAFAASATDAYARALSALPLGLGDVILTTENDYVSNQIAFLALQKRVGVKLVRARDAAEGGVDLDDFALLLQEHQPRLVAVTHVPTSSGLVQPVEALGALVREHVPEAWYIVDACQSAGQLPLDVAAIRCDFLASSMRKYLRGPRGAGFLYASDRVLEAGLEMLLPDMRSADWTAPDRYVNAPTARRFEYWEMPYALLLGSRAAIEYALGVGLEPIAERVGRLATLTRELLAGLPGVRVLDQGKALCGIVTAHHSAWDPKAILERLWAAGINCRVSPPGVAQIDFARKGVQWALRISPHYYNTEEEIRACLAVLQGIKV